MVPERNFNYLKYNLILLKMVSLVKLENSNTFGKLIHYFRRVFFCFTVGLNLFGIFVDTLQKRHGDFDVSVLNYAFLCEVEIIFCRMIYYFYLDNQSTAMLNVINKTFKYQSETGLEEKSMSTTIKIAKWITILCFSVSLFVACLFFLGEFFLGGYAKRILVIPVWYPYNFHVSPYYELTILIIIFNQSLMSVFLSATDVFYISTCLMIAKQFEILSWEIKNMLYTNLLKYNVSQELVIQFQNEFNDCLHQENEYSNFKRKKHFSKIYTLISSSEFQDDLDKEFQKLIKYHISLLQLTDSIENFFAPLALIYFVPMIVTVMMLVYTVISTNSLYAIIEDAISICFLLFEAFSLSYFAELIAEKTAEVRSSLYDFPWYFCNKKILRRFLIMHLRSSKTVGLTVGKFKTLDLNTFVWSIKTIYSCTTVLSGMNQKNENI